jgi:tRNA A37 threonylcarbamoyladenosine dehydratase
VTASNESLSRTQQLIGKDALDKLKNSRVAVFGIGGVGSYVVEALARSGVGNLDLIDNDTVAESNLNRQLVALHSTLGKPKVEVAKERVNDINPDIKVNAHQCFYLPEEADKFPFEEYDYIVDAIDTVKAKISLVEEANKVGTPIICSMGTGNKLDPTRFEISDISKTSVCPLAKVIRVELRKRGINHLKVLYSKEEPVNVGSRTPASIAFVPSVAGLIIAGEVIKDLIK